jgi:hypothetical protein
MSHGSYDSNLGSEILILGGDIRLKSWPNIGDSYGKSNLNFAELENPKLVLLYDSMEMERGRRIMRGGDSHD